MTTCVAFVGVSGAGKTTLIAGLIPVLAARGLRVGTAKHAAHGFHMDRPGTDTAKHYGAGADPVLIVGPDSAALQWRGDAQPLAPLVARYFGDCDIVLAEGFAGEPGPKVLVHRRGLERKHVVDPDELILVVTDEPLGLASEVSPDDREGVADAVVSALAVR